MNSELSEALVTYLERGKSAFPNSDSQAVIRKFGIRSDVLLAQIDAILGDASQIQIDWTHHTLISATQFVENRIANRHPDLNAVAIEAIGWAWSYWNK